ncbi:hypothetical protein B0T25DRAFT_542727 [Lasiosphaeria hispida]|uniref:Uncharacterized protein n=1 Tax=Lasiosphaeria hispida TaxID=260671 RepID=A0AAJ0MDU7_9PEZI|nr:hypothetical protein B0T25DRAFT_542727 [Lasiosphaeria hispida]
MLRSLPIGVVLMCPRQIESPMTSKQHDMALAVKAWLILPSLIYKPDDLIQLGQIVSNPRKPQERLAKPLPLPAAPTPRKSTSKNQSLTKTESGNNALSIFAYIVHSVKAKLSGSKSRDGSLSRSAAVVETQYFEITEDPSHADHRMLLYCYGVN